MFELRRDPVTGWWSAIVTDRAFEHASFTVEASPVEGTHCRHCDEAPEGDDESVRRITLRDRVFELVPAGRDWTAQVEMIPTEEPDTRGSWEIVVGPKDHHERYAEASPHLAEKLLRHVRDAMRDLGEAAAPPDDPLYVQVLQNHGRQAGARTSHLNIELYAIPQVPHRVAEEIGGAARHQISRRTCAWCAMAEAEEAAGTRLVLADERFVVFAPAASRSPFELWVVPREHAADFTAIDDEAIGACRATLQRALGALGALGDPPYNLFLHTAPAGEKLDQTFHWHWELHPRLRVIAGLERATALAVNPAAPEYAAEVLRAHLAGVGH
jgi:UDPglucose--hexose-1-phosphate uridylyltransferase